MEDCLFCKIIAGQIPSTKVFENDAVYAFRDINPVAPIHVLIVPKKHIQSSEQLTREDDKLLGEMFEVARTIAKQEGLSENGYRLVFNTGKDGGQTVPHIHMHLIGGKELSWEA